MDHTSFKRGCFFASILSYFEKLMNGKTLEYLLIRNFFILIILIISCLINKQINIKQFKESNYLIKMSLLHNYHYLFILYVFWYL